MMKHDWPALIQQNASCVATNISTILLVTAAHVLNQLLHRAVSALSVQVFCSCLKTQLFGSSFSDFLLCLKVIFIIIGNFNCIRCVTCILCHLYQVAAATVFSVHRLANASITVVADEEDFGSHLGAIAGKLQLLFTLTCFRLSFVSVFCYSLSCFNV